VLTDVKIEGLRGVGNVELHFAPAQRVYTLFGANGVGKTKCLEALYQFLLAFNKDFLNHFKNHQIPGVMTHMSVDTVTLDMPYIGKSNIKEDAISLHQLPVVFLGADLRGSLVSNAVSGGSLGKFADRRKRYFDVLGNAFSENGDLRSLGMSGDTRAWFVKRAQSVNLYNESTDKRQTEIDAVLSMLNDIDSRIDPEFLRTDDDDLVYLTVEGQRRELGELSSGFAALLKMIQAIVTGYAAFTNEKQLQRVRGIVLIDEIDAHLHVEWQAKIIPCLKRLLPNTTFYVATHSPLVLVRLMQKEAYLLRRDDGDGVVRSQMIRHPNRRLFIDVLEEGTGVDLNRLKTDGMVDDDQSDLKQRLLSLLQAQEEGVA
jgi:predicted ATPase